MKTEIEAKKSLKEIGIENLAYYSKDQYSEKNLLNICDVPLSKENEIIEKVEKLGFKIKYRGNYRLYFLI